jgi:hypothetical protein
MTAAPSNGNGLIPNSFQTPNLFVDRAMGLLEPEEYVCLSFATRHILGWREKAADRRARISLDYFGDGDQFGGVGLSRPKINRALKALSKYGLLIPLGSAGPKGQEWELPLDDAAIDWQGLETRKAERQARNAKRVGKAVKASVEKRTSTATVPLTSTIAVPVEPSEGAGDQYDSRTATSTATVPLTSTAVVHTETHIDQTHDQTHNGDSPKAGESPAPPPPDGEASAGQAVTPIEEKWGFKIGQTAYWWRDPRGGDGEFVTVQVLRFTEQRISVEAPAQSGSVKQVALAPGSLRHQPVNDTWKTLADLTPGQQVIARRSYRATAESRLSARVMTKINMATAEMRDLLGGNGHLPGTRELEAAYDWNAGQHCNAPEEPVKIALMVSRYREATHATPEAITPSPLKDAHRRADPACPICGGNGIVMDGAGKPQPCACLSALEHAQEDAAHEQRQ